MGPWLDTEQVFVIMESAVHYTKNSLCLCDGLCFSGMCREGERLVVGPTDEGRFLRLKVGSIQRNRSACRVLRAGQAATLALGNFDRSLLRKVRGHLKT